MTQSSLRKMEIVVNHAHEQDPALNSGARELQAVAFTGGVEGILAT